MAKKKKATRASIHKARVARGMTKAQKQAKKDRSWSLKSGYVGSIAKAASKESPKAKAKATPPSRGGGRSTPKHKA